MTYIPEPADTSTVKLPEEIRALGEMLARNAHECWAKQRIAEGWRYGPVRDDAQRLHPCLVPYDQLSESEKEYDRITSMESLRLIYRFGFRIEKSE